MDNFLDNKTIAISILNVDNLDSFLMKLNDIKNKNKMNNVVIHFDVMDGDFVPNIGVNLDLIKVVKKYNFFVDVHLMCSKPKDCIDKAIELGADNITIHYEIENLYENLKYINNLKGQMIHKGKKLSIGISIKPDTDVQKIFNYSNLYDTLLLMSVNPGLGGQKYIDGVNKKIEMAVETQKTIQIDGGINDTTILEPNKLGVKSFVIGSYITKDINKMQDNIMKIQNIIK